MAPQDQPPDRAAIPAGPGPALGADPGLAQLRRGEFGVPVEVAIRFLLVLAASAALFLYTGWIEGLYWACAYFASQGLAWLALTRPPPHGTVVRWLGYGSYMLTSAVFMTLPLWLMTSEDVALAYCGAMGMLAGAVFTLWREEPPAILLPFDVAIGWVALGVGLAAVWDPALSMTEVVIMVALTLTAAGYYTMALITTRAARVTLKAAAARGTEAQKMEAIGRLSGGIAHDFNNILTVLQGNLELYREIDSPTERDQLVDEALLASKRASGLIAQLLSFARRAPLSPSRLEVSAVIGDLASMAERVLPRTISVVHCAPPGVVHVQADHDRLLAALLNLVINARDAMEGRGALSLWAEMQDDGATVAFCVADDGPGMAPETEARALEPFFTTKPVGAGSGLGLPMAKGFAEQSGGALRIETGAKGTRVTLTLPTAGGRRAGMDRAD